MEWTIGDGQSAKFQEDRWLPNYQPFRKLIHDPQNQGAETFKIKDLHQQGEWNLGTLSITLPQNILNLLNSKYISLNNTKRDKTIRLNHTNSDFTVKSAYNLLEGQSRDHLLTTSKYLQIWNLQCPNKIKIFLWKYLHKKLPTKHCLHSIGISINLHCSHCNALETCKHIVLECPKAKSHWKKRLGVIYKINKILNSKEQTSYHNQQTQNS